MTQVELGFLPASLHFRILAWLTSSDQCPSADGFRKYAYQESGVIQDAGTWRKLYVHQLLLGLLYPQHSNNSKCSKGPDYSSCNREERAK